MVLQAFLHKLLRRSQLTALTRGSHRRKADEERHMATVLPGISPSLHISTQTHAHTRLPVAKLATRLALGHTVRVRTGGVRAPACTA